MSTNFDPFSEESMADPSSAYQQLLQDAPVHHFETSDPPFYTLSRFEDVEAALRDVETYSSHWGQGPRFTEPIGMLADPPQHTFFRSLVQKAFTPKASREMAGRIQGLADELADAVEPRGAFDVHDDYGFLLPVIIISEMLGVPKEDNIRIQKWSFSVVEAMAAEDPTPWEPDLEALFQYVLAQIADRRQRAAAGAPTDDLITRLVEADVDGRRLDDEEVMRVVNQLIVGGHGTTTSLITNVVWRLLQNPSLWDRLVADPDLIDTAIEESLRFDPSVLALYRTTTRDVELHGVKIPENSKVMMHYAAANRDPAVFEDPDTFSLDRPPHRHLAFGLGVHFCLGTELARIEGRIALSTLLRRFPTLSLVNDGERIKPFFLWGRTRLPVRIGR